MEKISIFEDKESKIDLNKLIESRLLICANSGGGKSYVIRKVLEESYNKVLPIVPKKVYEILLKNPGQEFSIEELSAQAGYSNSGSFNTFISNLCSLGLAQRKNKKISLNSELLEV